MTSDLTDSLRFKDTIFVEDDWETGAEAQKPIARKVVMSPVYSRL